MTPVQIRSGLHHGQSLRSSRRGAEGQRSQLVTWPYRLMARIWLFQSQEDGSEPSGAAAGVVERYHAGLISQRSRSNRTPATKAGRAPGPVETAKRGILIRRHSTAGCAAVNRRIGVRVSAPEPWDLRAAECSPPCQGGGRGFKSRRSRQWSLSSAEECRPDKADAVVRLHQRLPGPHSSADNERPATNREGGSSSLSGGAFQLVG